MTSPTKPVAPNLSQLEEEEQFITSTCNSKSDLSYSIVWSPLPVITWFFPFIGHTGICDSVGVASDFQGPYFVGDDGRMAFGAPTRVLHMPGAPDWDEKIQQANEVYRGRMHNLCCDNCHSHVAYALNLMQVSAYGIQNWDMVKIAAIVFFRARFLSWGGVVYQFLPFTMLLGIVLLISSK